MKLIAKYLAFFIGHAVCSSVVRLILVTIHYTVTVFSTHHRAFMRDKYWVNEREIEMTSGAELLLYRDAPQIKGRLFIK